MAAFYAWYVHAAEGTKLDENFKVRTRLNGLVETAQFILCDACSKTLEKAVRKQRGLIVQCDAHSHDYEKP